MEISNQKNELIKNNLAPIDIEELFNDYIDESNPPYKMGYLEFDASEILKCVDPIAYDQELSNFQIDMEENEMIVNVNGEYYLIEDVEKLLEQEEKDYE